MMKPVLCKPLLAAGALAASLHAAATPIVEVGKTVARADFSLTFDSIDAGEDLSAYREAGILVATPSIAYTGWEIFYGDPRTTGYHYPDSGNYAYTTIRGVNHELFGAADFLLGNGWSTMTNHMRYETYRHGVLTGSGATEMNTGVVRISDLGGFDELRLNSHYAEPVKFGEFQALALDDLHLQLWAPAAAAAAAAAQVPEPAQIALFGAALIALRAARRGVRA